MAWVRREGTRSGDCRRVKTSIIVLFWKKMYIRISNFLISNPLGMKLFVKYSSKKSCTYRGNFLCARVMTVCPWFSTTEAEFDIACASHHIATGNCVRYSHSCSDSCLSQCRKNNISGWIMFDQVFIKWTQPDQLMRPRPFDKIN